MKLLRNTIQKSLSVLLSFVMIIGMFAIIPLRAAAYEVSSWESAADIVGNYSQNTITLTKDVTAEESDSCITIASGKSFTIDLNGHTLSRGLTNAADNGYAIIIKNGGELTIRDSSGNNAGKITGGYSKNGGAICNEGTLTIESGTITENIASDKGGAIYNKGTLTVSGGCITNNVSKDGGGIYNCGDGAAAICGYAEITANKTTEDGGGGITNLGTLDISESVSVSYNYGYSDGGGIWNGGTATITGGSITVNSRIDNSGTANILLCDGASIDFKEGVRNQNNMDSELNIYAQQRGSGKLTASGEYDISPIGPQDSEKAGTVNIYGGTIDAGFGIGTAYKSKGGTVRIYGANVKCSTIGCGTKSPEDSSVYIGIYNSTVKSGLHNGAGVLDFYNSTLNTRGLTNQSGADVGGYSG